LGAAVDMVVSLQLTDLIYGTAIKKNARTSATDFFACEKPCYAVYLVIESVL